MSSQAELANNLLANEVTNILGSIAYRWQVATICVCLSYGNRH